VVLVALGSCAEPFKDVFVVEVINCYGCQIYTGNTMHAMAFSNEAISAKFEIEPGKSEELYIRSNFFNDEAQITVFFNSKNVFSEKFEINRGNELNVILTRGRITYYY
jgi:hypothetical protein